jgi:hypothetical protein
MAGAGLQENRIPWLADASDRLRLLHIEIDAGMRRLAWGDEFDHEHVRAFLGAIAEANRIIADVIKYVTQRSERRAYTRCNESRERCLEALERINSRNGKALPLAESFQKNRN